MRKLIILLATSLIVSGCTSSGYQKELLQSLYNVSSSGQSKFDGAKYVRVSHIACEDVRFSLHQDTKQHNEGIVLIEAGVVGIRNIARGQSLKFYVDSEFMPYTTDDVNTRFTDLSHQNRPAASISSKTYIAKESDIRKLAGAKRLLGRVLLSDNFFVDGQCSDMNLEEAQKAAESLGYKVTQETLDVSNSVSATKGLQKFVQMIDATEW